MAATAIRTLTVRFIVNSVKVMKRLYALVNLIQFFMGIFVLK
uniref:Uncharacterized protein n=1 Tax=virus sp. ctrcb4 TaxID=2825824 RepID=A0A8S5RPQ8_9VIRU|nr:MAG TPA: hypothetical protein [virus sp. ctrcb4]DAR12722.1 MAG TPA: hypothetical protein [Crassvirales sp.]